MAWNCWLLLAIGTTAMKSEMLLADSGTGNGEKHVIVVGGGLAGVAAALEIIQAGAKLTIIEGEKNVGGNSAKSSSGISAFGTEAQKKLNISDNFDLFFTDTVSAGDHKNDKSLVDILVRNSAESIAWLIERGIDLTDANLCGGHSVPRTHWIPSPKEGKPSPVGFTTMRALRTKLDDFLSKSPERITQMYGTKAKELIVGEQGRVVGVKTEAGDVFADAVVLTTGGYSNDHENDSLLVEFAADKIAYPTTNGYFAAGSGVKMARKIGAQLIDMEYVQIHPTGFVDPKNPTEKTKFLAAEALRGKGAILVNQKGERFANELGRRDYLTEMINSNCEMEEGVGHVAWMLMNEKAVENFGWPAFNFYWKFKGLFTKFDSASEFAEASKVPIKALTATLTSYSSAAEEKRADPFGKKVVPAKLSAAEPLFAGRVTPSIHYSMGGLKIDTDARVLSLSGQPIGGLFAAGEVTGGVHGKNRLAGNSLLECVVFGRIAGLTAAGERTWSKNEL